MNLPDIVNCGFELFAGAFSSLNCFRLIKDKKVRGYSPVATLFFTSWGLWNLFYYPHLDQWFSFVGSVAIVTVNAWWLCLIWRYKNN